MIERPIVFFALIYRRLRYGYAFRRFPLTKGKFAIVDPDDYQELAKHKWFALKGTNTFYAARWKRVKGKQKIVWMHRKVLKLEKEKLCDHINKNGLDNRKANLRAVNRSQNAWNRRKPTVNSSSKYKGLSWNKKSKKWYARIQVNNQIKFLGAFKNELAAAKAYDKAAREHHGQFAVLNFEDSNPV